MMIRFLLAAAFATSTSVAYAEFEVEEPETKEGKIEVEWNNAIFLSDVADGDTRSSHEVEVSLGVIPGWKSGLSVEIENERGESPVVEGGEWNNLFVLIGKETIFDFSTPHPGAVSDDEDEDEDGFSLALFAGFEVEGGDNGDEITFGTGPFFGYTNGPFSAVVNTAVEIPLGGDGNTGFAYAASLLYALTDDVAAGVEFHGGIDDVFEDIPSLSDQEHYIGPVISAEFEVDERRELEVKLGGFFGLTDETPDFALAINLELEIN